MNAMRRVAMLAVAWAAMSWPAFGQGRCANTPEYFKPVMDGDGQRYPLEVGPLTWHLLGSGIYPVKGSDGLVHLAFAVQLTSTWNATATIESVDVVDPARGNQPSGKNHVVTSKDEDVTGLAKLPMLPPMADKASYAASMEGGRWGVMFFDVTYADASEVPCAIALRVKSKQPEVKPFPETTITSAPWKVSQQEAIVIAPPFKGTGWLNSNGCCMEIGPHRFVTNPTNGMLAPSEQFAIDWIKLDEKGLAFRTDGKKPEDWLCYGVELLAVADGVVVEAMRDLPDEPPGKAPASLKIEEIGGNRVILDLGNGHYAAYAHMAPHSVLVHVGDHVKVGQKLGLLGNSGNTTGPHLHFQISDRPALLDTTALPFVFEKMLLEERTTASADEMENYSIEGKPLPMGKKLNKECTREMPLTKDVNTF
jgi:hypothetical protein